MKKVLVVEDNEKHLYLISFILKKNNCRVIETRIGEEGVALAIKEKFDFIIMDIKLPGIDGLEAVKRIRAFEGDEKIPIVAITSYVMDGDREKAIDAGCTDYIEKPINTQRVFDTIEKCLK